MISEFSYSPIPVQLPDDGDILSKLRWFLGHYDLRIFVSSTHYMDVGRGSLGAALQIKYPLSGLMECIGTVGHYCDFAPTSHIFSGSEHKNELPVNIVFTNTASFGLKAATEGIETLRPSSPAAFRIGNAVVVSADATLLAKANIGDGAVIAASAVVTGEVEAFTIYGGVPAKKMKDRCDEITKAKIQAVRWWDFDTAYLGNNLHCLQQLAVDTETQHVYQKPMPRFAIKIDRQKGPPDIQILGFIDDTGSKPFSAAPEHVRKYITQLGGKGPYQWIANVWN